jgi:hypothetical protein
MPSLGIHLLVKDAAIKRLSLHPEPKVRNLLRPVQEHPELAALGAIGPDILYYKGTMPTVVGALAKVLSGLNSIDGLLKSAAHVATQAGLPNIGELVQRVADTTHAVFQNLQNELEISLVELSNLITGKRIYGISEEQQGLPESSWNWGDLLHDRLSGVFATRLLDTARSSGMASFAFGYHTHISTDTLGHPYVNSVVGGPARSFDWRHTLAEKFMDQSVYVRRGADMNHSSLYKQFSSLSGTPELTLLASTLVENANFFKAKTSAFPLPDVFDEGDVLDAFRNMVSLFKLVTENSVVDRPFPPSIQIPPIPSPYADVSSALGAVFPQGARPHTALDFLKMLFALFAGMATFFARMVAFVADIIAGVIKFPIECALYMIQTALYNLYRQTRWFLVVNGMLFPYPDELGSSLGRQFASSPAPNSPILENYPYVPAVETPSEVRLGTLDVFANNIDFMSYPSHNPPERPRTRASPYPEGSLPELFMYDLQPDPAFVTQWFQATDADQLRRLAYSIDIRATPQMRGGFGNAADFSLYLILHPEIAEKLNCDSDRGYGYRHWTCNGGFDTGQLKTERLI